GSWNRAQLSGYKVVYVPFAAGRPAGAPRDVLTGFVDGGRAFGRPVGVAIDNDGALLVADDVGNAVWRVTARYALASGPPPPQEARNEQAPAAPPEASAQANRAARARARRRLRLDEGRQLAAGVARPVEGEGGRARASGRRERLCRGRAVRNRSPPGA